MESSEKKYWETQTVLITGSGRGIGRELARHFSALGCRVAINYVRDEKSAEETLSGCAARRSQIFQADVADESQVAGMVARIEKELGPVSVLVNNAGQTRDGLLVSMSSADWRSVIDTHLSGAFYCTRAVLPQMMRSKFGRIVNISSVSGTKGNAGQCNYSAAKAGLIGFTKALAKEVGAKNITCNALALGLFDTDMTRQLGAAVLEEKVKNNISVRRLGTTPEVAALAEYVCGPGAAFLTGEVIALDGGGR